MSYNGSNKKLVLITGAANGIGLATAKKLATTGHDLFILDKDDAALDKAVGELSSLGAKVSSLMLDLSDSENIMPSLDAALGDAKVDQLINNAGVGFARNVENTSFAEWDLTIDINLKATFIMCKYFVPKMIAAGGGEIVNVASAASIIGLKNRVAYCASKAGVAGLTRAICADHAAEGIRINAIAPGTVDSTWIAKILADAPDPVATRKMMEARQLDGKMGTPEEVANGIAFLLSPEGRFINGSLFVMDAGLTAV
ncbi:MAG: SDR family NAD(P)-dependent oxidoreductase [Candidatus Nanopelagicales bacterium]